MHCKKTPNFILFILWSACLSLILNLAVFAQSNSNEKPKLKNFGKSLKKFGKKEKDNSQGTSNNSADEEETIRVKTDLVVNDVLVINQKGNVVLGLDQNDFVITEDGIPQKIGLFAFGENAAIPRSIVLIIDHSGSTAPYSFYSLAAAKLLIDKLTPQDRMAIVTDNVELLVDFTKDKDLLKKALDNLENTVRTKKPGKSEQYTALVATLNEMFDEEDIRPVVILQSDGDELFALKNSQIMRQDYYDTSNGGVSRKNYSFEDVRTLVSKSRATIYSIIPGYCFIGLSQEERFTKMEFMFSELDKFLYDLIKSPKNWNKQKKIPPRKITAFSDLYLKRQQALSEIAELSGGYADYVVSPEDGENVYTNIFKVINNRYVIGYYPTNEERNGKRRDVKIEVKGHPEYTVMGRKSFFTPEQ